MIGLRILQGAAVEILMNLNGVPSIKASELMEYHRSRPRIGSDDWREADEQHHPPLWSLKNKATLPIRAYEALLTFDQASRDLLLVAEAACCKSEVPGKPEPVSAVSGEFIIRHPMRIVASAWGLAWWDDVRTTTSYVSSFEMMKRITW